MIEQFDKELSNLAAHLAKKAMAEGTDPMDAVKIFRELREYYAILTKDDAKGDKDQGRRPTTMQHMRDKIALVSRGEGDEPT